MKPERRMVTIMPAFKETFGLHSRMVVQKTKGTVGSTFGYSSNVQAGFAVDSSRLGSLIIPMIFLDTLPGTDGKPSNSKVTFEPTRTQQSRSVS